MEKQIVKKSCTKQIPAMHTLLIQEYIENCQKITISLLSGSAEIFGIELMKNYPHSYSIPCSLPVFSWDRAEILIEWSQFENSLNSSNEWIDITGHSGKRESLPMVTCLEFHYQVFALRKLALEKVKEGPRIAIVGSANSASSNISRLLLNYSGKYNMNPVYLDLDPESTIFIDGSMGALEFEYKICEDFYDRPEKICLYYGNRTPYCKSYFEQVKFLIDILSKKFHKQMKEYKSQGIEEEYPFFSNGIIIQCPKIKDSAQGVSKAEQYGHMKKILEICQATHLYCVGEPSFLTYLAEQKSKITKVQGMILQGTEGFLNMPRPIKSKIERYFDKESKKKNFNIDEVKIFELMAETSSSPFTSRVINIREEAISKNTIAVLHAKISSNENLSCEQIAVRAINSAICCLTYIFSIEGEEITLEMGQENFMEDFRDNIWVTSVSDQ